MSKITYADIARFLSKEKGTSFENEYINTKARLTSEPFNASSLMPNSISALDSAGLSTNQKVKFLEKQGMSYESAVMKVKFLKCW